MYCVSYLTIDVDANPMSYSTPFDTLVPKQECLFQLPGQNLSNGLNARLVFNNNSADDAGSVLYMHSNAIDNCKLTHGLESHISGKVFDMIVHNNDSKDSTIPLIHFKYAIVNLTIQTCYLFMVQSSIHSVSW